MDLARAIASVSCLIVAAWLMLLAFLVIIDRLVMELESSLLRSIAGLALFLLWIVLWYQATSRLVEKRASELRRESS